VNITLTQLKYALAVEKTRSFRSAARLCHVTQPTLSMQIQKLEDQLGILIFDRSSHPVSTTPMGSEVLNQIRVVINHAENIAEIISEAKNTLQGDLRLGIIPTLAPYLLPIFLGPFSTLYPGVQLFVEEVRTSDLIVALGSGSLDMGLLVTPLHLDHIREIPLFAEPFYVYTGQQSTLSTRETIDVGSLAQDNLLLLAEGHCMRDQVTQICQAHQSQLNAQSRHVHFESGSIETLCHLVLAGFGYTVVPHLAIPWVLNPMARVIPFTKPTPTREVSLVVHQSFVREAMLKAMKQVISQHVPKELLENDADAIRIPLR
jgi:LysR family hydrogen peroxide-inducible transcriptional activator